MRNLLLAGASLAAVSIASPAYALLGSGTSPMATSGYPGCMIPPISWAASSNLTKNQIWHINPPVAASYALVFRASRAIYQYGTDGRPSCRLS